MQTSAEELAVTFGEMRMLDPRPASISLDLKKDLLINAVRLDDVLKEIDNFKVFYASFSSSLDLHKALASPTGASPSIAQRRSTLDLAKFARMTEPLERQLSDGLLLIRDLVGRVAWAKDAREAAESAIAFIERCLGQWLGELSTEGSGVDVWRESSEEAPALSLRLFLRREEQEDLYTSVGGHEFWSGAWWTADEFSNSILRRQFTPAVLCLAATKEISLNNRELMTKLLEPRTWSIGSA